MARVIPLSDAIQHYLREIYKLGASGDRVSTTALAREMHVSPASASAMVKKLAALSLVEHTPYRGVTLTPEGERVALEVIRHHRLLELYLAETLGIDIDEVHDEADRLEHALSEELESADRRNAGLPDPRPARRPHSEQGPRVARGRRAGVQLTSRMYSPGHGAQGRLLVSLPALLG